MVVSMIASQKKWHIKNLPGNKIGISKLNKMDKELSVISESSKSNDNLIKNLKDKIVELMNDNKKLKDELQNKADDTKTLIKIKKLGSAHVERMKAASVIMKIFTKLYGS